ncbi:MAG: YggT family protein [Desulfobulbaceae bacterium]|nr:MAG: YggT family protein [Desulfobulbaceae bacterium]
MVFVNSFTVNVLGIISYILTIYGWVIVARVVISWVNADPYNPIVRFIYDITEPVLGRVRRFLPINFGGLDFSPIIVVIGIWFFQVIIESLQKQIIYWMG